ncbi:MAG: hypothetical protein OXE99_01435 [Cellvibrionales bacterium]|nr:hypothetical protein [Cellvibrionales bacterium]
MAKTKNKKLILHIGRHKTGTTSLQTFLFQNRDALKRQGVLYPVSGLRVAAHHWISEPLARKKLKVTGALTHFIESPHWQQLTDEIDQSPQEVVLLSSEAFQNVEPEVLAGLFQGFDVEVIVYLRGQVDYLASSYAQFIHANQSGQSLDDYQSGFIQHANFLDFLSPWEASFDNLHVSLFDKGYLYKSDVIVDFFYRLGLSIDSSFTPLSGDQNPSLSATVLAYKLWLNRQVNVSPEVHRRLYNLLGDMSREPDFSGKYQLDQQRSIDIYECFKQSNAVVAEKYLGGFQIQQPVEGRSLKCGSESAIDVSLIKKMSDRIAKEIPALSTIFSSLVMTECID